MSYNILNKGVKFQGDTQGTIENIVDTHSTQTINASKTITFLTGTHVRVTNDLTASGNISASINISASAFYGNGSNLTGIDQVVTALNNKGTNRLVTIASTNTELDGEVFLSFDGSSRTLTVGGADNPDQAGTIVFHYGQISGSGNISGSAFYGDGANLSNVAATSVTLASNGGLANSSGVKVDPNNATEITSADGADFLLVADNGDSNNLKKITCQRVANLFDAAVTQMNNKAENRLVTIANTTSQLDGEAGLTFDGTILTVAGNFSGSGFVSASNVVVAGEGTITAPGISLGNTAGIAGSGLFDNGGKLDVQVTGAIHAVQLAAPRYHIGITGSIAGTGLSFDGGVNSISKIKFDPASLSDTAMTVADDYIVFLDGGASGDPKKEQWADVINNVAHTGLDASGGRLSVDVSDFMSNGADNRLVTATGTDAMNAESNASFYGSTLAVTGTLATRDTSNTPKILESVVGASGSVILLRYKEIAHTCTTSGTSEDINDFFTPGMIPFALGIRVTTAITRGDADSPHITKIGVINDDDAFGVFTDNALEQSGDSLVTSYHPANSTGQNCKYFTNNHELRITYNAQPAAGAIRLGLYYYDITAPTS